MCQNAVRNFNRITACMRLNKTVLYLLFYPVSFSRKRSWIEHIEVR